MSNMENQPMSSIRMIPPAGLPALGKGEVLHRLTWRQLYALEVAIHELTTLHGLIAADSAAPQETFPIDTSTVVAYLAQIIAENESTEAAHSSPAGGAESALTPKRPGLPEAELPEHEYGLRHVGVPWPAFHETEDEQKNRLSAQRIADASARLMPGS